MLMQASKERSNKQLSNCDDYELELNQLLGGSELTDLEEEPSTNTLLINIINNYIFRTSPYIHI